MEPNRREFQKQCAFQSFCKRVLHNEACNAHDEIRRRRKREVSFCDLALHEERQLYTVDKYFQDEEAEPRYQMAGKEILLFTTFYMPAWNLGTIYGKSTMKTEGKRNADNSQKRSVHAGFRRFPIP